MASNALDQLYTKVARKVLTETLQVKKGDSVTVETWDNGLPFARRALAEARSMGCTGMMIYEDEWAYVEGVRKAPAGVVGKMGRNEYALLSGTDSYIFIPGQALGSLSRTLNPAERTKSTSYNSSWYEAAEKAGLKGARLSFGYVGKDLARALGNKPEDMVRSQLRAALADYGQISAAAGAVAPLLADGASVQVGSGKSALEFSLKGELTVEDGVVDDNDRATGNNMAYVPPGFVSKEVDPESARGSIVVTDSLTDLGVVPRVRLEFRDGRVVSWESEAKGTMKKVFDSIPPNDRRLRLLVLGLNPDLGYGNGQDRFVEGALNLSGFGFRGVVKGGNLKVDGKSVVTAGRPSVSSHG
jgi:leucyl aminopeptidase (aminopeptidase T)